MKEIPLSIMFQKKNATVFSFNHDTRKEFFVFGVYILALCCVPLLPTHQLIIGTIVNALLISAAFSFNWTRVVLLSLVPSFILVSAGIVFGGLTPYVLLMLPFVWVGNVTIALLAKYLVTTKKYAFSIAALAGATLKTALLFAAVSGYYYFGMVPFALLTAFGIFQFITASAGAIVAWMYLKKSGRLEKK